jgi:hypothetical protein
MNERDDAVYTINKAFNSLYDRLSEAYDLLRKDQFTDNDKNECEVIIEKLMNDTVGK